MPTDFTPPDIITGTAPLPDGTYTLDQNQGYYCSVYDVYENGIGCDWKALSADMLKFPSLLPPNGQTLNDMIVNRWIPSAEAEADQKMCQTMKPVQVTEFLDGNGTRELILSYTPVYQIDDLQIFMIPSVPFIQLSKFRTAQSLGNVNSINDYQDAELVFTPSTGLLQLVTHALSTDAFGPLQEYKFIKGLANVKVTYQHGFISSALIPHKLRIATAKLVVVSALRLLGVLQYQGMTGFKTATVDRNIGREKDLPYGDLIAMLTNQANETFRSMMWIGI